MNRRSFLFALTAGCVVCQLAPFAPDASQAEDLCLIDLEWLMWVMQDPGTRSSNEQRAQLAGTGLRPCRS